MKKIYLINKTNPRDLHTLAWCTQEELPQALAAGFERITRREAVNLCIAERRRRREGNTNAGRAPVIIAPWEDRNEVSAFIKISNDFFSRDGYVYERWT